MGLSWPDRSSPEFNDSDVIDEEEVKRRGIVKERVDQGRETWKLKEGSRAVDTLPRLGPERQRG